MDSLLSCLLLISVLALALSTEEQNEMPTTAKSRTAGSPTASPTATSSSDTDCSQMFDYIGPFCQYVYRYQSGFSSDTISTCMGIMHTCGSLRDEATGVKDICSSHLTSLNVCADPIQNDFFMDYCGMVQVACPRGSDGSVSASGDSGSGSSSASSFSESDPDTSGNSGSGNGGSGFDDISGQTAYSGTGSGKLASISGPGLPESGSGSAKLANISGSSGQLSIGSGSGQPKSGGGPGRPDHETVLTTTPLPYTTIAVS